MIVTRKQIMKTAHERASMRCDINPRITYKEAMSDALRFAWKVSRQHKPTPVGIRHSVLFTTLFTV